MTILTEPTETSKEDEKHEVATGLGVVGGAAVGSGIGTTFGPLGTVLGLALGAIGGAVAGRETAEALDLGNDDKYWRSEFDKRPYTADNKDYEHWRAAFLYGWEARRLTFGQSWEEVEPELEDSWSNLEESLGMEWSEASSAVQDAWDRFEERTNLWLDKEQTAFRERARTMRELQESRGTRYEPAFRFGMLSRVKRPETRWDEIEAVLEKAWNDIEDGAEMAWESVRDFVRDGWNRLGERLLRENTDKDAAQQSS